MDLQYINDEAGNPTGVFIPIKEWDKLKEKYHLSEDTESFSPGQVRELHARVDAYLENPSELLEWNEVKKRLLAKKNEI